MSETLYPIAVEVNGVKRAGQVPARTTLVDFLRDSCASPAPTSAASTASAAPAR